MNQTHITTPYALFKDWSAFETLAFLPHLQHLRFSFYGYQPISSRVELSQLKSPHIQLLYPGGSFFEWLDLPILLTLILHCLHASYQLPLLQHFLPHIHVLGFHHFSIQPPPNNPAAPNLMSIICGQPFGAAWENLPFVTPLQTIEAVHLSLESAVLILYPREFSPASRMKIKITLQVCSHT